MKRVSADLSIGEQQQIEKHIADSRRTKRLRDDRRETEKRIRAVKATGMPEFDDEDLIGIDLRRVKRITDLP